MAVHGASGVVHVGSGGPGIASTVGLRVLAGVTFFVAMPGTRALRSSSTVGGVQTTCADTYESEGRLLAARFRVVRVSARCCKLPAQPGSGRASSGDGVGRSPATVHVLCMNRRRLPPKATESMPTHIEKFSAVIGASWLLSRPERDLKTGEATGPLPSPDMALASLRLSSLPLQRPTCLDCPCSVRILGEALPSGVVERVRGTAHPQRGSWDATYSLVRMPAERRSPGRSECWWVSRVRRVAEGAAVAGRDILTTTRRDPTMCFAERANVCLNEPAKNRPDTRASLRTREKVDTRFPRRLSAKPSMFVRAARASPARA
jgi:hypothetical protein